MYLWKSQKRAPPPPASNGAHSVPPFSRFHPPFKAEKSICSVEDDVSVDGTSSRVAEDDGKDLFLFEGDLSRYNSDSIGVCTSHGLYKLMFRGLIGNVASKQECCTHCVENPLCIAWTYDSHRQQCQLKGRPSSAKLHRPGYHSGYIQSTPPVAATPTTTEASASSPPSIRKRAPSPRAVIFHGTSCFHNNVTFNRMDMNTIYIGR
jgi:hypothetical protein